MALKKTPGVYVQEVSTLPPSVAEVATAIPAFIGYTEKANNENGEAESGVLVKRIISMLEYRHYFGGPKSVEFTAIVNGTSTAISPPDLTFILYYSMKLYFENGGGPCYIVSIGRYDNSDLDSDDFKKGLQTIETVDEPTLLLFPDAVGLDIQDYCDVANTALAQCQKLGDRFTIMDVKGETSMVEGFRGNVRSETDFLKYGAAYSPYLNTLIAYEFLEKDVEVNDSTPPEVSNVPIVFSTNLLSDLADNTLKISYSGAAKDPRIMVLEETTLDSTVKFEPYEEGLLIIKIKSSPTSVHDIMDAWNDLKAKGGFILKPTGSGIKIPETPAQDLTKITQTKTFSSKIPNDPDHFLEVTYIGTVAPPTIKMEVNPDAAIPGITFDTTTNDGELKIIIPNGATEAKVDDIIAAWTAIGGFNLIKNDTVKEITITEVNAATFSEVVTPKDWSTQIPSGAHSLKINYSGIATQPTVEIKLDAAQTEDVMFEAPVDGQLIIKIKTDNTPVNDITRFWDTQSNIVGFNLTYETTGFTIAASPSTPLVNENAPTPTTPGIVSLDTLNANTTTGNTNTAIYNQVLQAMAKQRITLPPSPAIAGVYARVDRINGVWKTPANVSVIGISGPTHLITNEDQENLNVDATSGKSINAIRSFTGKGTLVWGGRTLAGNDNEWRYISVRRLFNLIEESIQKATSFAVFEANDATTWLKVKAMIDSYLYGLWQQGALAGSTPEQAFFVQVGLGKTMNTQDILEGFMKIEIGVAAVRPAEFIILKFSHKLQEA